jgi:hypothetical protein
MISSGSRHLNSIEVFNSALSDWKGSGAEAKKLSTNHTNKNTKSRDFEAAEVMQSLKATNNSVVSIPTVYRDHPSVPMEGESNAENSSLQ